MSEPEAITFVTSVSLPYYRKYGRKMVESFHLRVDSRVKMLFYHEASDEGHPLSEYGALSERVVPVDLASTGYGKFFEAAKPHVLKRGLIVSRDPDERMSIRGYDYRWDAVTFGKKAFSFLDATRKVRSGLLFWADADIVFLNAMPFTFLSSIFSGGADVAHFGRKEPHTETGFYGINMDSPKIGAFLGEYARYWEGGAVFSIKAGWTDSHTFDMALRSAKASVGLVAKNLSSEPRGPVISSSAFGAYMDHQKGMRKKECNR